MAAESTVRVRVIGALVLVGVFAAGAVFGAGLVRWTRPGPPPGLGGPPPRGPETAMIRELGLDPDQVAALHAIEARHRADLETIAHDTVPRVRTVLEAIEDELTPELRPDQVEKLKAWRARRGPPPMPGMGPPPGGPGGPPPGPPPPPGEPPR
jgi:hypothetical protein